MCQRAASFITVLAGIGKFSDPNAVQHHQNSLPADQAYTFFSLHLHTCTRRSLNFHEPVTDDFSEVTMRIGWKISPQVGHFDPFINAALAALSAKVCCFAMELYFLSMHL